MLSFRTGLPQYRLSPPKAQTLCNVLDIPVAAWNTNSATQQLSNSATQQLSNSATQQLSNSATQQLSNSATQQLRRKLCLRPEKRAALFHQQRNFFLYAFTGGVLFSHHRHSRCYLLRHILHSSYAKPAFGQAHHHQSFVSKREQCTVAYFFNRQDVYRIPPRMADIKNAIYFYQKEK